MKRVATIVMLIGCFAMFSSSALAGNFTLSGKQTAGSGHSKNAKTESDRLVLTQTATITAVDGDAQVYCVWAAVTPKNRTARSVLCGGEGRGSIIGKTLSPGTYTVLPGLNGKSSAHITITLK